MEFLWICVCVTEIRIQPLAFSVTCFIITFFRKRIDSVLWCQTQQKHTPPSTLIQRVCSTYFMDLQGSPLIEELHTHSSVLIVILGSCLMFTYYPEPLVLDVILGYAYAVLQETVAFWRCDWFKDLVSQAKTLTFFPLHSWAEIIMHHKLTDCLSLLSNLSQFFFISFSYCGWKSVYNSLLEKIQTKQVRGCVLDFVRHLCTFSIAEIWLLGVLGFLQALRFCILKAAAKILPSFLSIWFQSYLWD